MTFHIVYVAWLVEQGVRVVMFISFHYKALSTDLSKSRILLSLHQKGLTTYVTFLKWSGQVVKQTMNIATA